MKERNPIEQDNAILDFESYQAQESILDPNLPDWFKDKIVSSAVATIKQVGERKASYNAKEESQKPRELHKL